MDAYQQREQQDNKTLVDLEKGLDALAVVGRKIRDRLSEDVRLLDALEGDVEGATGRTVQSTKEANPNRWTGPKTIGVGVIAVLLAVVVALAFFMFWR